MVHFRAFDLLGAAIVCCDAEGRVTAAVLSFQDITPIKEQERLRDFVRMHDK